MANIGLNIPPGFTITTEVCAEYNRLGKRFPEKLWPEVEKALKMVSRNVSHPGEGRVAACPSRLNSMCPLPSMVDETRQQWGDRA